MKHLKHADNFAMVKSFDTDSGVLNAVASNASVDRDGESIAPDAFVKHLSMYQANPVILSSHMHRSADATPTIIGSAQRISVENNELAFDMTFASTKLGTEWKTLFSEGHAKAFSVGFIPKEGGMQKGANGKDVYTHTEVELLEISAVGVPSNREALSRDIDPDILIKIRDMLAEAQAKTAAELQDMREAIEALGGDGLYSKLFDRETESDNTDEALATAIKGGSFYQD